MQLDWRRQTNDQLAVGWCFVLSALWEAVCPEFNHLPMCCAIVESSSEAWLFDVCVNREVENKPSKRGST
jgi:hypothetical protein